MRRLWGPAVRSFLAAEVAAEGAAPVRAPLGALAALSLRLARRLGVVLARREVVALAVILCLALGLRSVWVWQVEASPDDGRFDDTVWYHYSAVNLVEGKGYIFFEEDREKRVPTARWPPGYSGTLAGVYALAGENATAGKALNVVLGAGTCLLLYGLGSIVFSRTVGLVAALVVALFPSQIYFSALLLSETLFVFLFVGILLLAALWTRRGPAVRWYQAAVLGALVGVSTYVRGEALLLPLLLTVVWLVAARPRWRGLALGGVAALAAVLVVTPWIVRNAVELGYPVVMSTGTSSNLFAGHWEGADGGGNTPEGRARLEEGYEHLDNPEWEIAVYKASFRRSLDFAVHHPLKELTLVGQKLYNLYREDADGVRWIQGGRPEESNIHGERFTVIANGYYFIVVGLTLLSAPLWFTFRDPRRVLLIGSILYFSFVFGVIFIGEPRHHFPVMPVASLLAAAACVHIWEAGRRRSQAAAAAPAPPYEPS